MKWATGPDLTGTGRENHLLPSMIRKCACDKPRCISVNALIYQSGRRKTAGCYRNETSCKWTQMLKGFRLSFIINSRTFHIHSVPLTCLDIYIAMERNINGYMQICKTILWLDSVRWDVNWNGQIIFALWWQWTKNGSGPITKIRALRELIYGNDAPWNMQEDHNSEHFWDF